MGRIRAIRNEELIEAAIAALAEVGFANVTMAEIARHAGSTAPSITYYFGSKAGLMAQTMRHLLGLLRAAHVARLGRQDRLEALLCANFDARFFTRDHCAVWVQFWANAPFDPGLSRLQRINRTRVERQLIAALRGRVVDPAHTAIDLQAWMDGVWLSVAQGQTEADAAALQVQARERIRRL